MLIIMLVPLRGSPDTTVIIGLTLLEYGSTV